VRETSRRLEMATLKTYGARYVKAVAPWGWAWRWTCQGMVQPWGAIRLRRPARCLCCVKTARERGARAVTGPKQLALAGSHGARSWERPPPGTMEGRWGGGLEVPAPGMEDTEGPRELGADATRGLGEAFEGFR
jgi:hypothetical protein